MLHPSTKRLIDRLCEMTTQRKIDWAIGEQPDSLVYDTEGYRVLLEGTPAELVLRDALGKELERASQDILNQSEHIDGGTYADLVATMHQEASRIARGTEDAIASVLGGLNLDDPAEDNTLIPEETPVEADEPFSTPIADAVEDNADEMSALQTSDSFPADTDTPEGTFRSEQSDTGFDQETPDLDAADESLPETILDAPLSDVTDPQAEVNDAAAPGADQVMSTPMPAADEIVDAADLEASSEQTPAFEQTPFEETPDVGKAVADLANQVNEGASAEAQFEAPKEPAPQRNESSMRASTITNFATSSLGMPTGALGQGAVFSGPARKPDPEPAPSDRSNPVNEATPVAAPEAPAAPVAPPQETQGSVWKPGQTLSLSGLAPDDDEDDVVLTPEPSPPPANPSFTAPQTPVPSQEPQAATPTPSSTTEDPASAEAPSEETPEEPAADEQAPKRFNPWV